MRGAVDVERDTNYSSGLWSGSGGRRHANAKANASFMDAPGIGGRVRSGGTPNRGGLPSKGRITWPRNHPKVRFRTVVNVVESALLTADSLRRSRSLWEFSECVD